MPSIIGATRPIAAFAATAASMALPPRSRIAVPARAASGCSAATIPYCEITMDRACVRSSAASGAVARSDADAARLAAINGINRHWPMRHFPRGSGIVAMAALVWMLTDGRWLIHGLAAGPSNKTGALNDCRSRHSTPSCLDVRPLASNLPAGRHEEGNQDQVEDIVILGGPNGAGKTTAAQVVLPQQLNMREFVNAERNCSRVVALQSGGSSARCGPLDDRKDTKSCP